MITDSHQDCDLGSGENTEKKFGLVLNEGFMKYLANAYALAGPIGITSR